jgi:hypothetical protein
MSTLKVTNIQSNAAGFNDVVSFQNSGGTQNGTLCRTWVVFNGTGVVSITASFNVSSITDNGTGDYAINFTNAMSNASYSAVASVNSLGSVNSSSNSAMVFARSGATNVAPSTTSMACCAFHPVNTVNQDVSSYCVAVFR